MAKTVNPETVVHILQRARWRITKKGWTQGTYYIGSGDNRSYCAVGAICHNAREGVANINVAHEYLKQALPPGYRTKSITIENYNDNCVSTKRPILALYDRAIAMAQEQCEGEPLASIEEEERTPALV